jgi:hypothetical protein
MCLDILSVGENAGSLSASEIKATDVARDVAPRVACNGHVFQLVIFMAVILGMACELE